MDFNQFADSSIKNNCKSLYHKYSDSRLMKHLTPFMITERLVRT